MFTSKLLPVLLSLFFSANCFAVYEPLYSCTYSSSPGPGPAACILPTYLGIVYPDGTIQTSSSQGAPLLMGAFDGQAANANGATITGNKLYEQSATASFPGLVNTSSQTFAGVKTFNSAPNLASLTASSPVFTDASKNLSSTGTVNVSNGGTGLSSIGSGAILYGNGGNSLSQLSASSQYAVLQENSSSQPSWALITNNNLSGSAAISNANLASMASSSSTVGTVKGNISGVSATPSDLTLTSAATNSSVMYRDSTGSTALSKIQVGTSSYVQGTALISGTPGNPATTLTSQPNAALRLSTNTGNNSVLDFGLYNTSPYGAWIQSVSGGDLSNNYPLVFEPNGGNVGIGIASPTAKLHVNGTSQFESTMTLNNLPASKALVTDSSKNVSYSDTTGTGNIVRASSPVFSGTINLSSIPASKVLVTDASSNLSYADTTGTGNLVRSNDPIFGGSITSPLIYGGSATNQGMTFQSTTGIGTADYIKFNVGNNGATEVMRLDTSGNVGIGKNNPGSKLDVQGTVTATAMNDSGLTGSQAVFTDSSDNLVSNAITGTGSVAMSDSPVFTTKITDPVVIGGTATSSSLELRSTSGVGATDFIKMTVGNNGATEAMRIDTSGNVGIGKTNPGSKLDVNGTVTATGMNDSALTASQAVFSDGSKNLVSNAITGTGSVAMSDSPTFTTKITDPLVIGGTGATSALELRSTSGTGTTDFVKITVGTNGGKEGMRITHDGNVGIGVTNPTGPQNVRYLQIAGAILPSGDQQGFQDVGAPLNRWNTVYAMNGTINTSDQRQKKDIEDSNLGLDFINLLRPVSYHWKAPDQSARTHYGLIAQEVEEALSKYGYTEKSNLPIVNYDKKSDSYGLSYTEVIAPLVKAVQTLSNENFQMKSYLCAKDKKAVFCSN